MFKITGLDKLHRELAEAQRAMSDLDGELGTVRFDPHDPSSIETAIQLVNQMVDQRVGQYASNPIVGSMIDQMKDAYRESIVKRAAAARLNHREDE
jgi:hypothetical protein